MIKFLRILLISFFIFAGSYHFINPEFYLGLIPDYLPYPMVMNYFSGVLEVLLGIGVALPQYRRLSAYGIMVLMLLFIPSHVHFIQMGSCIDGGLCVPPWLAWLRLIVIHPLLIYWAWAIRK